MKRFGVILLGIVMTLNLYGCSVRRDMNNMNSSNIAIVSEVIERNDNTYIFSDYASVESTVTYPQDDSEESSNISVYYSEQIYSYQYSDLPDYFGYLDSTMMVGNSPDADYPTYGVIVDEEYYSDLLEEYKSIHFFGTNNSTCSSPNSNTIEYIDESEVYTYVYNPETLLVVNSSCRYIEDDIPWCTQEYNYNMESKDSFYTEYAKEYVDRISGGQTVTLTINSLDGTEKSYSFPKGFSALLYSNNEYVNADTGELYDEEVINDDTVFIETATQ